MMKVRWPEGQYLIGQLIDRLQAEIPQADSPRYERFTTAMELFFPGRRGNAEPGLADEHSAEEGSERLPTQRRAG